MDRQYPSSDSSSDGISTSGAPAPAPLAPRIVGPLDLTPVEFRQGLGRRLENRNFLIAHIREVLVDGIDYGAVPIRGRMSKPSLRKPGAEKICNMCGVIPTFPSLRDYERLALEGKRVDTLLIRCELHNADGIIVGEGAGARTLAQDYDDPNKGLKMCLKSAQIDATIRTFGLSEIFTQDLEDMPEERRDDSHDHAMPQGSSPPAQESRAPVHQTPAQPARPQARASSASTRLISDKQAKLLWVRLDQSGIPEGEFLQKWNLSSLDALPASMMNEALNWITSLGSRGI